MPCWYYDRQELRQMCSYDLDAEIEARYRKEGARFILDCGGKMGLRYETSATGVVYFHRFYLFHSFKEFNRHLTAACCLFLAGKVEETPKKCKDIIKVARGMLSDQQFAVFGDDPRRQQEEVMTMERILLQTIKFDLQVEHPYAYLLKFAKMLKENVPFGDKAKIQHMVQMAWTFINDSMCTTLCLQWEPDIIAIALMYLASRLTKFDIHDWQGKTTNSKGKWWDHLVEDVTLELLEGELEDICHQVLDLYSPAPKKREMDSPPPPPPPRPQTQPSGSHKRSRSNTPSEQMPDHAQQERAGAPPPPKISRTDSGQHSKSPSPTPAKQEVRSQKGSRGPAPRGPSTPTSKSRSGNMPSPAQGITRPPGGPHGGAPGPPGHARHDSMSYNPYMSSGMYSSSFMSQEGAQSIQSLIGGGGSAAPPSSGPPPAQSAGYNYNQPAQPGQYSQPRMAQPPNYPQQQPYQNYPQQPPPTSYPPPQGPPPPPYQSYQQPQQPPQQGGYDQYPYTGYGAQPPTQNQNYPPQQGYPHQPPVQHPAQSGQPPPPQQPYPQPPYHGTPQYQGAPPASGPPPAGQYNYQAQPPGPGGYQGNFQGAPGQGFPPRGPPQNSAHPPPQANTSTGLAQVRITGRR